MESEDWVLLSLLFVNGNNGYMKPAPNKTTYVSKHYQAIIGIGNDHVATVTIDEDALKTLCDKYGHDIEDFIEGNFKD